jgi:uncharacterized protein (TIGR02444 family)
MTVSKTLPGNPFWDFSVWFYQHPLVEQGLLSLQEERGLNVNIVLFCFWSALKGHGRFTKSDLKKILVAIQIWHEEIVVPIRRIRKLLKSKGHWPDIYNIILKNELFTEQIEQLIIYEKFIQKTRSTRTNSQKLTDICRNIATYCQLSNSYLDLNNCKKICEMLATLFTKIDQEIIMRYCIEHLKEKELRSLVLTSQFPLDL